MERKYEIGCPTAQFHITSVRYLVDKVKKNPSYFDELRGKEESKMKFII